MCQEARSTSALFLAEMTEESFPASSYSWRRTLNGKRGPQKLPAIFQQTRYVSNYEIHGCDAAEPVFTLLSNVVAILF